MQHETSRRALIGGVGLAALVAGVPAAAAVTASIIAGPQRVAWDTAHKARADVYARDADVDARYKAAETAGTLSDELETEWDESAGKMADADWALFETPAPDLAALQWKVSMLRDHGCVFDEKIADQLLTDFRSIAGGV